MFFSISCVTPLYVNWILSPDSFATIPNCANALYLPCAVAVNAAVTVSNDFPELRAICVNVVNCSAVGWMPFRRKSSALFCNASNGWIVSRAACCNISNISRASLTPPVVVIKLATAVSVALNSLTTAEPMAPAEIAPATDVQTEPMALNAPPISLVSALVFFFIF